jgi:ABC-type branched-subunit amino acid transport system ATPase component
VIPVCTQWNMVITETSRYISSSLNIDNLKHGASLRKDSIKNDIEKVFNRFPGLRARYNQQVGTLAVADSRCWL